MTQKPVAVQEVDLREAVAGMNRFTWSRDARPQIVAFEAASVFDLADAINEWLFAHQAWAVRTIELRYRYQRTEGAGRSVATALVIMEKT